MSHFSETGPNDSTVSPQSHQPQLLVTEQQGEHTQRKYSRRATGCTWPHEGWTTGSRKRRERENGEGRGGFGITAVCEKEKKKKVF